MAGGSRGVCNTRCQSFYNECLNKENSIRVRWFLKNQQKLLDQLDKANGAKATKLFPAVDDEFQRTQSLAVVHIKAFPNWRPPNLDGFVTINIMKPVNDSVRLLLYEKDVESFTTAENYILERVKESPEDRYYYPECSSWIYGWRRKDYSSAPRSKFGMKSIIQTEFYHPTESSLKQDPEWYRPCQTRNPKDGTYLAL